MLPGIYLAHKTVGLSSFDVVRSFKRAALEAGQKKWVTGHGGTLDPFARGLLLILSGQATRLMELIHPLPKVYEAEIAWGAETDTCDHMGSVVFEGDASSVAEESLNAMTTGFLGWTEQVPPAASAKKIGGEAAYKKARRGETVVLPPSKVYLHDAVWLSHDLPRGSRLRITCKGGYYVRSLARDMGRALGCGAHLSGLYRATIGPWSDPGENNQSVITGADVLPWRPKRMLSETEADHLAHGRPIEIGEITDGSYSPPSGFPDAPGPIAGIFNARLTALLTEREGKLWTTANLRGGV
ncbi:MAG: tRNA pseudouridine(55) synthase TruB [Holophagales bacterium]|jgi:tRNA pseudouridine55 synthase|nr:tRNA pseudouridine(55) synthase TruB [Holophagales bacterium]